MRAFDFSPFLRSAIGFDDVYRMTDNMKRLDSEERSYPPYDIVKAGEDNYRITMALAGFAPEDLDVSVENNTLTIKAQSEQRVDDESQEYLHRGIAKRGFERRFQLADMIKVTSADFENGLLHVELVREIPEHMKPRQIDIGGTSTKKSITGEHAA
ncbi:MAG: Hsp20 family protein [Sphingomonadales bacterium]|nr:Hsp20 family protein [Sphingomonadales bacterium]